MAATANVDQAAAWDGAEGDGWTDHEEQHNEAVRVHTARLFATAQVAATDQVLDVGCGCGETTREAARRAPHGGALGVDLSAKMLERARERSREAGLDNTHFELADAQVHEFEPGGFDLVVSRTGVMFFEDPVAAFTNIVSATKPGGRMVVLVWQELARNEWVLALRHALAMGRTLLVPPTGAPGAFGLADPDVAGEVLRAAGWVGVEFEDVEAPFRFGADPDDAFGFARATGIVRGLLDGLDRDAIAAGLDNLRAAMAAHDTGDGVVFDSRAWIITARRS